MFDQTIPMIGLVMRADIRAHDMKVDLPAEYSWRFFRPGDEFEWGKIQIASGAFNDMGEALRAFKYWFPEREELPQRMLFLTENGVPFATSAAWFGDGEERNLGRVHWVAIAEEKQGKRLSVPLVGLTVEAMRKLGHESAYLTTQTSSWTAIKTYYKFGFIPSVTSDEEKEGWEIVSQKTGLDFMKYIQ